MNNRFTKEELELQLSCPQGELGVEVGENMHKSNQGMILKSIGMLTLKDNLRVLEIGHGNGKHIDELMKIANGLTYTGLEVSKAMQSEAMKNRGGYGARYHLYDGISIPYIDGSYDRVLSVNTIYFWSDPQKLISEIERVLDIGGICVLTYIDKEFAENLPFVGKRFKLYDYNDILNLVNTTNLNLVAHHEVVEDAINKSGQLVKRIYHIIQLVR